MVTAEVTERQAHRQRDKAIPSPTDQKNDYNSVRGRSKEPRGKGGLLELN